MVTLQILVLSFLVRKSKPGCFDRKIGIWCNGNTTDSGGFISCSNPGIPTDKDIFKLSVKDKVLLKLQF